MRLNHRYLVASLCVSTFGCVDGSLASLSSEAELPASSLGSALLLAFLESGQAFWIFLALSVLAGALFLNAVLNIRNWSQSSLGFDLIQAVVIDDALPECRCLSVALLGDAVSPAGLTILALLLASLQSIEASSVVTAGTSLSGAVLLDTVFRCINCQSSVDFAFLHGILSIDFVQTVMIDDALPECRGLSVALLGDAVSPAGLVILALFLASLQSVEASSVVTACTGLIRAVLLDAIFRCVNGQSCFNGFVSNTSVGLGTFCSVDGSLATFWWKADCPARDFSTAFLLTILESWDAFRIGFTSSPLVRAFLFYTLLGDSLNQSSLGFDLIQAVVIDDALPECRCLSVALLGDAVSPAGLTILALLLASLQSIEASSVVTAGTSLSGAVLLDTVFRCVNCQSGMNLIC